MVGESLTSWPDRPRDSWGDARPRSYRVECWHKDMWYRGAAKTFYADLFWIINFVVDGILLFISGRLAGFSPHLVRLGIAAAIGATAATAAQSYGVGLGGQPWATLSLILFVPAVMVVATLGWPGALHLLHMLVVYYLASALLGGIAVALVPLTGGLANGWLTIILALAAITLGVERLYSGTRRDIGRGLRLVGMRVEMGGRGVTVTALIDSGDELVDPLSGLPAAVVELDALAAILPPEGSAFLRAWQDSATVPPVLATRLRWLPYHGLGEKGGTMIGVVPDRIQVALDDEEVTAHLVLALTTESLDEAGRYHALLPLEVVHTPPLFQGRRRGDG